MPAGGEAAFSHPGEMLWESYTRQFGWEPAGWDFDPRDPLASPQATFRFDYYLPEGRYFWPAPGEGVYWISIEAVYDNPDEVEYPWGWKTGPRNPASPAPGGAVRIFDPVAPQPGDEYVSGEPIYWPSADEFWDMAFELTTHGVDRFDFGDAPEGTFAPAYPTRLADNGARHVIDPDFFLGSTIDDELDGQPDPAALGDDDNDVDDEDGVVFTSTITPGLVTDLTVTIAAPAAGAFLDAWVDFSQDGGWAEPGDQIFTSLHLTAGVHDLSFPAPDTATPGRTYARFRLSSTGGLGYVGLADDGEVEDYLVMIEGTQAASVVARHVFYNGSAFDGNNTAPSVQDDGAIAPDKEALLPGQTATFANYTSYSRGINGIMVDIAGLPEGVTLGAADFEFRVGNSDDPSTWVAAPQPASVDVRTGEGVSGSDRVTLVWPDGAIQKTWLQITVLATANTGLAEPEVFYFGNAIGETGNSATDAKVNAFDRLGARDNPRDFRGPAPIDFAYDFNRDGRVNATDMLIARDNPTSFLNALKLITVPGGKAGGCDAVRGTAATREPAPQQTLPARWDWLCEFEPVSPGKASARRGDALGNAVDRLLATASL